MRDLKRSDKNVLAVKADGEEFEIFYRQPTTSEVIAYNRGLYDFAGADGAVATTPRMNYGCMVDAAVSVITGWSEGAFGFDGQPISADPQSPTYRADWPALLKDTEARILIGVASQVFGGALVEKKHPFVTS
jgi:hypothetical protein